MSIATSMKQDISSPRSNDSRTSKLDFNLKKRAASTRDYVPIKIHFIIHHSKNKQNEQLNNDAIIHTFHHPRCCATSHVILGRQCRYGKDHRSVGNGRRYAAPDGLSHRIAHHGRAHAVSHYARALDLGSHSVRQSSVLHGRRRRRDEMLQWVRCRRHCQSGLLRD